MRMRATRRVVAQLYEDATCETNPVVRVKVSEEALQVTNNEPLLNAPPAQLPTCANLQVNGELSPFHITLNNNPPTHHDAPKTLTAPTAPYLTLQTFLHDNCGEPSETLTQPEKQPNIPHHPDVSIGLLADNGCHTLGKYSPATLSQLATLFNQPTAASFIASAFKPHESIEIFYSAACESDNNATVDLFINQSCNPQSHLFNLPLQPFMDMCYSAANPFPGFDRTNSNKLTKEAPAHSNPHAALRSIMAQNNSPIDDTTLPQVLLAPAMGIRPHQVRFATEESPDLPIPENLDHVLLQPQVPDSLENTPEIKPINHPDKHVTMPNPQTNSNPIVIDDMILPPEPLIAVPHDGMYEDAPVTPEILNALPPKSEADAPDMMHILPFVPPESSTSEPVSANLDHHHMHKLFDLAERLNNHLAKRSDTGLPLSYRVVCRLPHGPNPASRLGFAAPERNRASFGDLFGNINGDDLQLPLLFFFLLSLVLIFRSLRNRGNSEIILQAPEMINNSATAKKSNKDYIAVPRNAC